MVRNLSAILWSLVFAAVPGMALAQSSEVFVQARNNADLKPLTQDLGDPFFRLVLNGNANKIRLSEVEALIQPDPAQRATFVVDERVMNPQRGQSRRVVVSFNGTHGPSGIQVENNVMLSVFLNSETFSDAQDIEAWGWDKEVGVYNYYRLDRSRTPQRMTWKFRGSSRGAEDLTAQQRAGTCMACHVNGAPVMKELLIPWNNWDSFRQPTGYLRSSGPGAWPVANDPKIRGARFRGAEILEGQIFRSIREFNRSRAETAFGTPDASGSIVVADAQGLLRPLFTTTEVNLISSEEKSGLHPFAPSGNGGTIGEVRIPNAFFLNANLIGGNQFVQLNGLGISAVRSFGNETALEAGEYETLIRSRNVRLGNSRGDANFAWFVPEASFVDNDMVQTLMQRGALTPEFVAAVLAIDLRTPVFSERRAALMSLLPGSYRFTPLASGADPLAQSRHPDALTQRVIQTLEAQSPAAGTDAAEFLSILKTSDPRQALSAKIDAYLAELQAELSKSDPARRAAKIGELYDRHQERWLRLASTRPAGNVIESGELIPLAGP